MLPAGAPLSDWLAWLETLHPAEIDLGLERVQQVLDRLDVQRPGQVLLIGGTNGKGSSVAMAAALLRAAGLRVGAYTSPHILAYNERIAVDGKPVSDDEIRAAFERVEAVRQDVPLTYFEYGTLAAFVVFAAAGLDVWLLEVGMGGRLDATNVIDPTGVLITNVSLDHCDWLGDDVETIATEKAGIMRPGIPVVFGDADVPGTIVRHADAIGARLLLPERDFTTDGVPQPGLPGAFQVGNAAAVLALLDAVGLGARLGPAATGRVLADVRLRGRGQRLHVDEREWLIDVAHNPAAAARLAGILADAGRQAAWAVVGVLDDKDVEGMAGVLDPHVGQWIAVTADSERAIPDAELARRIANRTGRPCLVAASFDEAFEEIRGRSAPGDMIVVTGSFYLVGPALERLELYSRPRT